MLKTKGKKMDAPINSQLENDETKNKTIINPQHKIMCYNKLMRRILENALQKERNECSFYVRFLIDILPENVIPNKLIHDVIIIILPSTIDRMCLLNSRKSHLSNSSYRILITESQYLCLDEPLIVKDVDNVKNTISFFDEFPIISIQKCIMKGENEWIYYLYDELKSNDTELISIKNEKDHQDVWNKSIETINSISWQ